MTIETGTVRASAGARIDRYRRAERLLWDSYGLKPTERFIELNEPAVRLRVLEVGSGEPVLFIPGTGGTGPYWAPLIRELSGFRCLLLDRPGWGLSSPIDFSKYEYKTVVADLLSRVLDGLGVDHVRVVGASIGNVWALRLATRLPSRVARIALLGGGPLVQSIRPPLFVRLLRSPIGQVMVRLPEKPGMLQKQLRGIGHGASLDAGRIPDEFLNWHMAFIRDTESMRNERDMVRVVLGPKGWRPGLTFDDAELASIGQPVLMVYGTADPVGSVDIWKRFVTQIPQAELELVGDGGHLPWYDNPSQVGERVRRFLAT
jgi:pimeloyl-ACP methyl ester carboxylesterase